MNCLSVEYTGKWEQNNIGKNTYHFGGLNHWTNVSGATASLSFESMCTMRAPVSVTVLQ